MKYFLLLSVTVLFFLTSCGNSSSKTAYSNTKEVSETIEQSPLQASIDRGALVYKDFCNQCHRPKGKGVGRSFPPLAGSNWLTEKRTESIKAVKYGQKGEIEVNGKKYDGVMTPMGLSDKEVADVMNYIMNTWGNTQDKIVTVAEVEAVKQ